MIEKEIDNFINDLQESCPVVITKETVTNGTYTACECETPDKIISLRYYHNRDELMCKIYDKCSRYTYDERPINSFPRDKLFGEPYMFQMYLSYIIAVIDNE